MTDTLPRNHIDRVDKDDCAVYAVAFTCNCTPEEARRCLAWQGRRFGDGLFSVQSDSVAHRRDHERDREPGSGRDTADVEQQELPPEY